MLFRMVEMTKKYPYFNEDAETNWKEGNSNMEMTQSMACILSGPALKAVGLSLKKIDQYKVCDMIFKKQEGTSLPLVDFSRSPYSTGKEK